MFIVFFVFPFQLHTLLCGNMQCFTYWGLAALKKWALVLVIGLYITFFLKYLASALFSSEIKLYFTDIYELYISTDICDTRGVTISFTIPNDDSTCGLVNIDKAALIIFDKVGYLLLSNIMAHHKDTSG